jgi:Sulfotransferase domain
MLDFLGLGAQKAATSWLFKILSMHPRIYFPLGKEVNFWNQEEGGPDFNFFRKYYFQRFSDSYFVKSNSYICGEISPYYAVMPTDKIDCVYQKFHKLKTIYIIRNPVSRGWSAIQMSIQSGKKQNVSLEILINRICSESVFQHGNYAENIKRWTESADRVGAPKPLILIYERLNKNPRLIIDQCCKYLGINGLFYNQISKDFTASRILKGSSKKIPGEVLEKCTQYYADSINAIKDLINDDIQEWGDC